MSKWILLAVVAAAPASAQSVGNVASLASVVNDTRAACSTLAATHRSSEQRDIQQLSLDSQAARQKIRNDVELYSIGHGRASTDRYMLDLMKNQSKLDKEANERGILINKERNAEVAACVSDAVPKGKAAYAAFKKGKRTPADLNLASDLMTSWLVNVETISVNQPEGTSDSNESWRRAKAAVELSSP
ncbi:hypothetical protein [Stenotrophomonas sp. 24(2023)]|uniref:hypothetical protein n=1 Tax=Stenotrophomonas sp. 24(2023) TaxID=3068324 RepID=UPI0027DFA4C9|nr:hypothetical protein [Stenotrophomonas sp. 24(2023)]WMJ68816.1 hypothetical protein Q9R17_16765 [Stenotrophomonas sp. 24(2023)]